VKNFYVSALVGIITVTVRSARCNNKHPINSYDNVLKVASRVAKV